MSSNHLKLDFSPLTTDLLPQILAGVRTVSGQLCDRTVLHLYMWARQLDTRYLEHGGFRLLRSFWNGQLVYAPPLPLGESSLSPLLRDLARDAADEGYPLVFDSLSEEDAAALQHALAAVGFSCTVESDDRWSDYLYRTADLAAMAGRAYHGPRNHINRFLTEHADYTYTPLSPAQLDDVLAFYSRHRAMSTDLTPSALAEAEATADALALYPRLLAGGAPLLGGVLRADGEIVGFSLGELGGAEGNTAFEHIEKANTAYSGAYPMLVREFARLAETAGARYINREEDDGNPGLRRSKLAYRPTALLRKYLVRCS